MTIGQIIEHIHKQGENYEDMEIYRYTSSTHLVHTDRVEFIDILHDYKRMAFCFEAEDYFLMDETEYNNTIESATSGCNFSDIYGSSDGKVLVIIMNEEWEKSPLGYSLGTPYDSLTIKDIETIDRYIDAEYRSSCCLRYVDGEFLFAGIDESNTLYRNYLVDEDRYDEFPAEYGECRSVEDFCRFVTVKSLSDFGFDKYEISCIFDFDGKVRADKGPWFIWASKEGQKRRQRLYQKKYDREHSTMISIKLNNETDADIIEWLSCQGSRQGAIKRILAYYVQQEKSRAEAETDARKNTLN